MKIAEILLLTATASSVLSFVGVLMARGSGISAVDTRGEVAAELKDLLQDVAALKLTLVDTKAELVQLLSTGAKDAQVTALADSCSRSDFGLTVGLVGVGVLFLGCSFFMWETKIKHLVDINKLRDIADYVCKANGEAPDQQDPVGVRRASMALREALDAPFTEAHRSRTSILPQSWSYYPIEMTPSRDVLLGQNLYRGIVEPSSAPSGSTSRLIPSALEVNMTWLDISPDFFIFFL